MKNAIFLFLFLSFYHFSLAQFTISSDSVYMQVETGNEYAKVDIHNDSIGGNILWKLTTDCEPEDWTHYVMDINIAYIPPVDSLSFFLDANESAFLSVFLLHSEPPGMAKYTMEIWEEGDREHAKFVEFYFNGTDCEVTGTNDPLGGNPVKVYPNPFVDRLNIETQNDIFLELYNTLGQLVKQQKVSGPGTKEIFLPGLQKGHYSLVIRDMDGTLVEVFNILKTDF